VPAVEISAGAERGPKLAIVLATQDAPARQQAQAFCRTLSRAGVDPLLWRIEDQAEDPDYLYPCSWPRGERPLGIQAAQLAAIARWAREKQAAREVKLVARPRSTWRRWCHASSRKPSTGGELYVRWPRSNSYRGDKTVRRCRSFRVWLLEDFDIVRIAALAAPRQVVFQQANERVKKELAPRATGTSRLEWIFSRELGEESLSR